MGEHKCSQPEYILSLFLMKYKEVLESVLGFDVEQIQLEKNHGRNQIDFYAICPSRRLEVFVECQVKPSDPKHFEVNIMNVLNSIQEGIVIWIASAFRREYLEEIKSYLGSGGNKRKYINFYALEVKPDVVTAIYDLNSMSKLTIWDNLHQIKDLYGGQSPLSLRFKHEKIHSTHQGRAIAYNSQLNKERDTKEYVIQELRRLVPELLNVHREKKCNQSDRIITIGAGRSGFSYRVSVKDRREIAFVELFMDANQEPFYRLIRHYIEEMRVFIHEDIQVNRRRVGVYFKPDKDLDSTISIIASILKRLVKYFSPYLYGDKNIQMANGWNQK